MGEALITRRGGDEAGLSIWQDSGRWELLFTGSSKTLQYSAGTVTLWTPSINFNDYSCLKAEVYFSSHTMTTANTGSSGNGPSVYLNDFGGQSVSLANYTRYMNYTSTVTQAAKTFYMYIYKLGNYWESNASPTTDTSSYYYLLSGLKDGTDSSIKFSAKTLYLAPTTSTLTIRGWFGMASTNKDPSCTTTIKIYGQK